MIISNEVIEENEVDFSNLVVKLEELGYHSKRKGSEIMVDAGCTLSPPM